MENAKEIGRAFSLGYAFHAVFLFRCNHTIAKDAKSWITIKGTHVPVDDKGNLRGNVGKKIEAKLAEQKGIFNLESFNEKLEKGSDPRKVLKAAAQSLVGSYQVNLPKYGTTSVKLGSGFVKESAKYLYSGEGSKNPKKRKEIAKRQLFAMSKLETILSEGIKTKWENKPNHHPEYDFLTSYKRMNYQNENILFSVDIRKKRKGEKKEIYNAGNSKNLGFSKKLKSSVIPIKPARDTEIENVFEIIGIRC